MKWRFWSDEPEVKPWPSVDEPLPMDDSFDVPPLDLGKVLRGEQNVHPLHFKQFQRKEKPKMSLLRYDVTVSFTADPAELTATAAKLEELRKFGTLKIKTTNVRAPKSAG